MDQLAAEWSFLWDKRRSLWIAAEDCPDGGQIEEADLDMLLARLPLRLWTSGRPESGMVRSFGRRTAPGRAR